MTTKTIFNYRALNEELESILDKLQTGELDIDQALLSYERGMEVLKELENYLKTAENQVIKLKKQFSE